ncbi:haloacid dehalogenase type II [Amycolatopsis sp. FDAARGOS 1241]|uniref:haloacid dehalogenase type II n=1 Tax=Amycolatopsis sp. FDAARGOS 1241 TaxID=2778070 RepID=UPI0019529835|nr:haloacid dehalogenase type II [Amycolatopsis sp. FDAARGOS 1241]QRP48224.1 haloacid dehalogenase type II [Amycolatopsis sp. FDAARGOS 1241]
MTTTREALAFDVYGTLVDPLAMADRIRGYAPDCDAAAVAEVWRRKQLEVSFRLAAMGRYEDFAWCTRRALGFALATAGQPLGSRDQDALAAEYEHLAAYPDAAPAMEELRGRGHALAVLSNGTPDMLAAVLRRTGLAEYLTEVISVHEVRTFKPAPEVYHHAARRLGRSPQEVRLVTSNAFDSIGAEAAGLRAAWVDRGGRPFEPDGAPPDVVVTSLAGLAAALPG